MLLALRMADGASKELQERKKNKNKIKIKINVVGLLIYSSDEELFKPNIHGWRKCGLQRCLTLKEKKR